MAGGLPLVVDRVIVLTMIGGLLLLVERGIVVVVGWGGVPVPLPMPRPVVLTLGWLTLVVDREVGMVVGWLPLLGGWPGPGIMGVSVLQSASRHDELELVGRDG